MEQDKAKIISDLYAIRATMSVVAEMDDAVQPKRDAITALEEEQSQRDGEIGDLKETFRETLYQKANEIGKHMEALERERQECEKRVEDGKTYLEEDIEEFERRRKRSLFSYLWESLWNYSDVGCTLGVILVMLALASIAVGFSCGDVWGNEIGFWMGVSLNCLICILVILGYILGICVPIAMHDKKYTIKYCEQRIEIARNILSKGSKG